MKIAVLGATGRTGRQVVERALDRGMDVVALARSPEALTLRHARLRLVGADAEDPQAVAEAVTGTDAVISTLGVGGSRAETHVYSRGVANAIAAMGNSLAARLVVVSAAPAGPRDDQPFFERRIVMPVLDRFFGASYADMRRMEAILAGSDVEWTALRPPRLLNKPATGAYRASVTPVGRAITISDLADALLDMLDRDEFRRQAAYVAN